MVMKANGLRNSLTGLMLVAALALFSSRIDVSASDADGPLRAAAPDLVTIHDADSSSFNKNCLNCHQDVMKQGTLNNKIKNAHAAMVPFAPGYDYKQGATNEVCISCHTNTDLLQHSGAQIRKNVSASTCATCHNKSGLSSKKFYAN
jgi:hypothetical protein